MEVFLTSAWVPAEWVQAHGLQPRGVWAADQLGLGASPLAAGVCAFADAVAGLARNHSQSAVVFASHCDQLRRSFDAVTGNNRSHCFLFNLPVTVQTQAAEEIFCAELERLGRFLVRLGGHSPSDKQLALILGTYADARGRLLAAASDCPARLYAEAIARFYWDGSVCLPSASRAAANAARAPAPEHALVPLALLGGPLPKAQWHLLDSIEDLGGRVVLNATEAGERTLWSTRIVDCAPTEENAPNSLTRALAREYLAHCVDVFQRPNHRLYQWLQPRLALRQVRGIVLRYYVGCDLWRAEAQSFREGFGLPVLLLEADETSSGTLRERGRLEAFIESLR